jgi:transposase
VKDGNRRFRLKVNTMNSKICPLAIPIKSMIRSLRRVPPSTASPRSADRFTTRTVVTRAVAPLSRVAVPPADRVRNCFSIQLDLNLFPANPSISRDVLCQLVGRSDFLYVADCKLASTGNMNYIARQQGCFITVLPRTRKEDQQFRQRLLQKPETVAWQEVYVVTKQYQTKGQVLEQTVDRLTVCSQEILSQEGYRLLWYHSTKQAENDARRRAGQLQRATRELTELRDRLQGSKTRFGKREKVEQAVQEILKSRNVEWLLSVDIIEQEKATYRQARWGRPSKKTKYVKQVEKRFDLSWTTDPVRIAEEQACDGIFPLISNVKDMTSEELLRAYKRQPIIEKRFSHLKTDYSVAPAYLKSVSRIQALLAVYFFVLIVQTLLERELRQAMQREKVKSLPLYPEGRDCRRPTTRKVLDLFAAVQRHQLSTSGQESDVMLTQLSSLQKDILKLLGISSRGYGR